jgi:hypothetical protein
MSAPKLKPCPFCGAKASETSIPGLIRVGCNGESCHVRPWVWADTLSLAVAKWNKRAPKRAEASRGKR